MDYSEDYIVSFEEAADILSIAVSPVGFTGAGMSAESGVRTFRGEDGYWKEHRATDLATPQALHRDPKLVWEWYKERLLHYDTIEPHPGFHALKRLQDIKGKLPVITQNVDGLHHKAGLSNVIELHGSLRTASCLDKCGASALQLTEELVEDIPPYCSCGAVLRPDVVLFDEALPMQEIERAFGLAESCDLILGIGTSMQVYPAAGIPVYALRHGAHVIEINPEKTSLSGLPGVIFIEGKAGEVLPRLVDRAFNR